MSFSRYARLIIKSKSLSSNLRGGTYKSIFKGGGFEFCDLKPYCLGDDIRYIDWKGLAKNRELNVKLFSEEKSLNVFLLCDTSASMSIGKNHKGFFMNKIIHFMIYLCRVQQHSLGVGFFDKDLHGFFSVKSGKKHQLNILDYLSKVDYSVCLSSLKESIKDFLSKQKKRTICFLISDFFTEDYHDSLKILRQHHDVRAICLRNLIDVSLPIFPFLRVRDIETRQIRLLSRRKLKKFQKEREDFYREQELFFKSEKINYLILENNANYLNNLAYFLSNRA